MRNLRTRVVNFRVTDEELERLRIASDRQGSRCLSDFARSIIFGGSYDERLLSLEQRLTGLERSVARLVEGLSGSRLREANSHN
jgi:hypothetical protein